MDFVKFTYENGRYRYIDASDLNIDASDLKMHILGSFLATDVGCIGSSFKEFAFNEWETETASNITSLRKEHGKIFLSDLYSEEDVPTELKMTVQQFVQLLDDWRDKVCGTKPKEVIIKYENDQFVIETKN